MKSSLPGSGPADQAGLPHAAGSGCAGIMRAYFCGTRGSTPVSGAGQAHYGGHTSCVGLAHGDEPPTLVLDAGTGLQQLSLALRSRPFRGSVLLSHLHWDHTHGMPFFPGGTLEGHRVDVYLPEQGADPEDVLARAIAPPHFPIRPKELGSGWTFHSIEPGPHELEGFSVLALEIPHKGGRTFGYRSATPRRQSRIFPTTARWRWDPARRASASTMRQLSSWLPALTCLSMMPSTPRRRCPGWVSSATPRWSTRSVWPNGAASAGWCSSTTTRGAPTRRSTGWCPTAAGPEFRSSPRSTGWCWTCHDAGSPGTAWNGRLERILDGARQGRRQVVGEFVRPVRRNVLPFAANRTAACASASKASAMRLPSRQLGEIHETVALPVHPVRTGDQCHCLGEDRVRPLVRWSLASSFACTQRQRNCDVTSSGEASSRQTLANSADSW